MSNLYPIVLVPPYSMLVPRLVSNHEVCVQIPFRDVVPDGTHKSAVSKRSIECAHMEIDVLEVGAEMLREFQPIELVWVQRDVIPHRCKDLFINFGGETRSTVGRRRSGMKG